MSVTVEVYGPNLFGATETLHVHQPGCRDTRKALYRHQDPWTMDCTTVVDVVTGIYDPYCFDYNPDDADDIAPYEQDIRIFPCVKGLTDPR